MPRGAKDEATQSQTDSLKKSQRRQKSKKDRVAEENEGDRGVATDVPASVQVQLDRQSKKEEKQRRKEKKRKRGDDVENDGAEDSKRVKTLEVPIVTPFTMPSPPTRENEASEKKSRKSKKRKEAHDEVGEAVALEDMEGTSKKEKLSKKAKMSVKGIPAAQNEAATAFGKALDDIPTPILEQKFIPLEDAKAQRNHDIELEKRKKQSKKEKKEKEAIVVVKEVDDGPAQEVNGNGTTAQQLLVGETTEVAPDTKKSRFVVFIGNLPFTASKEDVQKHLEKIQPTDIRITTDKRTKKSKGFAFVEFDRFDRMETCLKKYQHSVIGEGKDARKINVELTAGGGGNTEFRKTKIQAKNNKLHEERIREREKREELEAKQQDRKQKKEVKQNKGPMEASKISSQSDTPAEENGGIHPARLAMMNKPATPGRAYGRSRY